MCFVEESLPVELREGLNWGFNSPSNKNKIDLKEADKHTFQASDKNGTRNVCSLGSNVEQHRRVPSLVMCVQSLTGKHSPELRAAKSRIAN